MANAIVIGDGPAGLSAALFLAKNGVDTVVYAQDRTAMHYAELHNYLGIDQINGSDFQRVARAQVTAQGAELIDDEVTEATREESGRLTVRTAGGGQREADYLVLAAGKTGQGLADQLGLTRGDSGVEVDAEGRTSVDEVYATGRLVRPQRSQAIISAGAGAAAALDILARIAGKDVTDWDSPPDDS